MKYIFILFTLLIACSKCLAQEKTARLSGIVTDSEAKPVLYATVNLFRTKDLSAAVRKTLTSDKGTFTINADTGRYVLVVSHVGFAETKMNIILRPGENPDHQVTLTVASTQLAGITIAAVKPLIEQTNDRIIYNAAADPANQTGSAADILQKAPLVTVDGGGNLQLNGQGNFRVLLNGRETAMFSSNLKDALNGFPGSVIAKVEVITNPSAKYDADGAGGVINIITKKMVIGYNGYLSSSASSIGTLRNSASLNSKSGKWGFTGFVALNGPIRPIAGSSLTESRPSGVAAFSRRELSGDRFTRNTSTFGNLELSYAPDSLQTMVLYGSLTAFNSYNRLNQSVETYFPELAPSPGRFERDESNTNPTYEGGIDYIRKFGDRPGHELDIRVNSQFTSTNGAINSLQSAPSQLRYVYNDTRSTNAEHTLQLDYIRPINKNLKLETGSKAILRYAESDFRSLLKSSASAAYQPDPNNTNVFSYRQQVYAAYASLSIDRLGSFLRLGLRGEHTAVHADFISSSALVRQAYSNLIPNLLYSKKLGKVSTLDLSYTMRLQRPYITALNPFVSNNDSLMIAYGNPGLKPQIIHLFSLQDRINTGKGFIALGFGAIYTDNMIIRFATFDRNTGVTTIAGSNGGKELQLSIRMNANIRVSQKWTISMSPLLRYNHIENLDDLRIQRYGISGSMSMNFTYRATTKLTISGNGNLSQAPYALLSSPGLMGNYQVNAAYKFIGNKLSVTLNLNNFPDQRYSFSDRNRNARYLYEDYTS